jgi:hypothetical protein
MQSHKNIFHSSVFLCSYKGCPQGFPIYNVVEQGQHSYFSIASFFHYPLSQHSLYFDKRVDYINGSRMEV